MLRKLLLVVSLLLLFVGTKAQKEYNTWIFNDSCSLFFENSQLLVNTIANTTKGSSTAVICNKHDGSLLFYSDGNYVYDKLGNKMQGASYLYGCGTSTQGALIVP